MHQTPRRAARFVAPRIKFASSSRYTQRFTHAELGEKTNELSPFRASMLIVRRKAVDLPTALRHGKSEAVFGLDGNECSALAPDSALESKGDVGHGDAHARLFRIETKLADRGSAPRSQALNCRGHEIGQESSQCLVRAIGRADELEAGARCFVA